ncbi:MAG: SCP2 sterol-binding domain-containing protein [Candidatus Geothermincolia bacterium]
MGEQLGIQEYIETYIPQVVGAYLKEKPIPGMEGTVFTINFSIDGEKSFVQGITIRDASEISVTRGGDTDAMLTVSVSDEIIKHIVAMVTPLTGREQYDTVKGASGTVELDLTMPGGWKLPVKSTFNGGASPTIKISAEAAEFAAIASGQENAPMAFMQGKIKMEGDMAFGLSLAKLFM